MLYDVNASLFEIDGGGSDGAYDLVLRGVTADEIADKLRETLSGEWGLTNAGPCRLGLSIGPAGSGDSMPL